MFFKTRNSVKILNVDLDLSAMPSMRSAKLISIVGSGQLKKQMKADYKEGKSPELKALLSQLDEIRAGWGKYKLDKIAELMGMKTR